MMIPSRRHRFLVLALSSMAAGIFFVMIARGAGNRLQKEARSCDLSPLFSHLPFEEMSATYHYTMEQLVEERLRLYEGSTLLQCDAATMDGVLPPGSFASVLAAALPLVPDAPSFQYGDFLLLLEEFWRTYDCHLFALTQDVASRQATFRHAGEEEEMGIDVGDDVQWLAALEKEILHARQGFDRTLQVLRSSEAFLPLHASLRCLQRGATDLQSGMALLHDAAQCAPVRLSAPATSVLP